MYSTIFIYLFFQNVFSTAKTTAFVLQVFANLLPKPCFYQCFYFFVETFKLLFWQVRTLDLSRDCTRCVQLHWRSRFGIFPPAVSGDWPAGHPEARTLHLRRMGHGRIQIFYHLFITSCKSESLKKKPSHIGPFA